MIVMVIPSGIATVAVLQMVFILPGASAGPEEGGGGERRGARRAESGGRGRGWGAAREDERVKGAVTRRGERVAGAEWGAAAAVRLVESWLAPPLPMRRRSVARDEIRFGRCERAGVMRVG